MRSFCELEYMEHKLKGHFLLSQSTNVSIYSRKGETDVDPIGRSARGDDGIRTIHCPADYVTELVTTERSG